jgi:hypothetical protein
VVKPNTFRSAFCAHTGCADASFERRLFWRSLYRHALPVAFLVRLFNPSFFRDDDEFIRWVGGDSSLSEVAEDVARFQYGNWVRRHWLRTGLRLQLDPERITALARRHLAA